MATLNLSSNGSSITKSYQSIVNAGPPSGPATASPTYGQWTVFVVSAPLSNAFQQDNSKESMMKVQSTGEGELIDLIEEFSDGRIQFAFVKVKDPNTTLPKFVLIGWCGEGVPERTKGYFTSHLAAVSKLLHGYHVQITARSDRDITPEGIVQKVADASGSKYSGGPASSTSSGAPPPPVASKPAFMPTRVGGGGGGGFNPLGSRSRVLPTDSENVDADGWGSDAPPVTRTQLEKVESAYKPTKVDLGSFKSQSPTNPRMAPSQPVESPSDVVRGGYQPIGKVDIAAIRRQARESGTIQDDRPTTVKGAYEPVGKVDIAAIRAKAQGPSGATSPPSSMSPAVTGTSGHSAEEEDAPKSLAERSAAFTQSERMTSLPRPKVANKFGSGSSAFSGTKAPTPGGFSAKPVVPAAPVGAASRTFADQGGKTPAQLWAEKKARQGGNVSVTSTGLGGPTAPVKSQPSGEGGWKSSYTGKTWAPVQITKTGKSVASNASDEQAQEYQQEEPPSSVGGIGAIRSRLEDSAPPPPMDMASKPNAGASRGVPMPGLPDRPAQEDYEDIPAEQSVNIPSPPKVPRSPSPPTPKEMRSSSPIRVAMPVGRGQEPEIEPPEERFSPPPIPTGSIAKAAAEARSISPEPQVEADELARGASEATAASTFGAGANAGSVSTGSEGQRAMVQFDYEKAEDNEIELQEGEFVTNIDMVDADWWLGRNSRGETGLFPSNYVELIEEDAAAPPAAYAAPAAATAPAPAITPAAEIVSKLPTATAQYDYEAAEDNELSFPEGAKITGVEFPDEDWWLGHYGGKSGLFPANYVELDD